MKTEGTLPKETPEELRAILYSIGDAIIVTDREGRIHHLNPEAKRLTGWSEADARGKDLEIVFRIIHEASGNPAENPVERVHKERVAVGLGDDTLLMTREDSAIPMAGSAAPIYSAQGEITGVVLVFRDQAKERAAQRVLGESEARFRSLFEQAAIGAAQVDTNTGRFVWINQRYCDIVGYSREEMQALDFQTITHPDDLTASLGIIRRLMDGQIPEFAMEKRYRRKDGQVVWVNLTVSPMWKPGETPSVHIAVVENITERKQAEEALQQRAGELAVLNTLGKDINATLSLEQTVKVGLTGIRNAVRPDMAFLFLLQGERLVLQDILPPQAAHRLGAIPEHKVGECLCGLALKENRRLFSLDILTDPRCTWEECKRAGIRSFAALPLRSGEKTLGVIGLASETKRDFEPQAGFLETLAGLVATSLTNARLYETARKELAERLRVEKALRLSEEYYRLLFDAESDAILLIDNELGQILRANAAAGVLYGYTPEEILCKKNVDLSAETDKTEHVTTKTPPAPDQGLPIDCR